SPRTRAILPVHLYGQLANMRAVIAFAERHRLAVIEDAAQSIGARWDGRAAGTMGLLGCYSFYPGKNLGAAGEAGLVTTNDATIPRRSGGLRTHGQSKPYIHAQVEFNYRREGLRAAILRHKLLRLDAWTASRRAFADRYRRGLAVPPFKIPAVHHLDHFWHLF